MIYAIKANNEIVYLGRVEICAIRPFGNAD
jgi:hypothetical protein